MEDKRKYHEFKTFKDLEKRESSSSFNRLGIKDFGNGYGVSVIYGSGAYGNEEKPYELAILFNGELCYDTLITNDVIGYLTEEKVSQIMIEIQKLK